jgi:type I restriction enzyme S subunit
MRKYPKCKDSGIEWFGEIPFEWEILPFRYYFSYTKGSNGQKLTKTYIEENIGEYPVYSGQTENNGILGYVNEFEFNFDSPVVFTTTVGAKFMTTRLLTGNFSLSQNCLIMIKKRNCSPSFFQYLLSYDFNFRKELIPNIIQPSLRMEDLDRIITIIPSIQEQEQIVTYLDKKTILIDQIISNSEKKIELLKEQRTSTINHVVTKGLNPKVRMKDTGVEWIGEIPEGWGVSPLKFLGNFQNGISKGGEFFGTGFPFMNYGDVYKFDETPEFVDGKVESNSEERERYSVLRGDVFFTRTSESKDDIGVSSVCLKSIENCVFSGFVIRFRFFQETLIPNFSKYLFQSHWKKVFIESKMNIVTRSSLSQQVLGMVPILIPTILEQNQIVIYLDQKTKEIDDLISSEQKRIQLIKEYRQSLIYEVVTGKIMVSNS